MRSSVRGTLAGLKGGLMQHRLRKFSYLGRVRRFSPFWQATTGLKKWNYKTTIDGFAPGLIAYEEPACETIVQPPHLLGFPAALVPVVVDAETAAGEKLLNGAIGALGAQHVPNPVFALRLLQSRPWIEGIRNHRPDSDRTAINLWLGAYL